MVLLGPLQEAPGDLLQRGALRNPGDLKHLSSLQVLVAASPSLRLDAERPDDSTHPAGVHADEPGGLRERRERADSAAARLSNYSGHRLSWHRGRRRCMYHS